MTNRKLTKFRYFFASLFKNEDTIGFVQLKRKIYLIIIPILNSSFVLSWLFSPSLDDFFYVMFACLSLFLTISWIFAYRNMCIRTFELITLFLFGLFHLIRVFLLSEQLLNNIFNLYMLWAPLYFIFVFMVLRGKQALLYSLMIYMITLFLTVPHMPETAVQADTFSQLLITHLIYIIVVYFFQRLVSAYNESDTLLKIANEDFLTRIGNRRMLDNLLQQQINLLHEVDYPISVILIDIDHFKKINDRFGHEIGDNVLVEFVALIENKLGQNDVFGRWGGEEFVIIALNRSLTNAKHLSERLRNVIEHHCFDKVGNMTASFGISTLQQTDEPRTVLERADQALYEAKLSGRNTVKITFS